MKPSLFRRYPWLINLWPPLLGAGIKVVRQSPDFRSVEVELRLTRLNRNYVGVHFGGSLFAMTDPFYMVMLAEALGPDYIVWDKSASIRFRRPGKGTVRAHFELTDSRLDEIRTNLEVNGIHDAVFVVDILNQQNELVSQVERTLYVATKIAHKARLATRQTANLS